MANYELIVNSTTNEVVITESGSIIVEVSTGKTGPAGATGAPGETVLEGLTDINIGSPISNNEILQYNSSSGKWENTSLPAGLDLGSPIGSVISHTSLQDIGTLTHSQLELSLDSKLAGSPTPLYTVSATDVGLGNVDNTSDLNKPISTATQNALDLKLDGSPLPLYSFTETNDLTASVTWDNVPDANITQSSVHQHLGSPIGSVISHTNLQNIGTNSHSDIDNHISNTSNPHSVTATQVGLGNVDNTSDLNKPISTATQTALDNKLSGSPLPSYPGHTHLEADITDLGSYLTDITGETLESLSNVSDGSPNASDGDVLTYNTTKSKWEPQPNSSGVSDHGALTGLSDDDHTQYALIDGSRDFTNTITVVTSIPTLVLRSSSSYPGVVSFKDGVTTTSSITGGGIAKAVTIVTDESGDLHSFLFEADGTFSVAPGAGNYEDLVTSDDDIPNKKYVDDEISSAIVGEISFNTQTGTSYECVIGDANDMITMNNASANTVTIPANASVSYPVGTQLHFQQLGAGQTTVAITSDTLNVNSNLTLKLNGQYAVATALKMTSTTWTLFGNLEGA